MQFSAVGFQLPDWIESFLDDADRTYPQVEQRMDLAIELARRNCAPESGGGPFGAAIFDMKTWKLLAPGVNLVTTQNCSMLHAEVVACMVAQNQVGHFDLGDAQFPGYELVTSTEPCAMCMGAIPWSGVRSVVCGAQDEDARKVGFEEGIKPTGWVEWFEKNGIAVQLGVCRDKAAAVLTEYGERGGIIYNSRSGEVCS